MGKKISLEECQKMLDNAQIPMDVISETHIGKYRRVICRCRNCNNEVARSASSHDLLRYCWHCTGKAAIPNKTDIATTHPWIVKYLKDKTIAYKYKAGSNERVTFKCPECGDEKDLYIKDVKEYGFKCTVCGDKLTKPNKFLRAFFSQFKVDGLVYEYHSEWTKNRKYDAYFELNGVKYVIEMDGDQHRLNTTWSTLERQKLIDKQKNELARLNGIHLIRIEAEIYNYDYWVEQFENCEIGSAIKEANIDWNKCIEDTETNQTKLISDYFNTHTDATLKDVSEAFGICRVTAAEYLKIGAKLGWCNYSHEEAKKRSDRFNAKRKGVRNRLIDKDGNIIGEFDTYTDCAKTLSDLCEREVTFDHIRSWFKRGKPVAKIQGYIVEKVS